MAQGIVLGHLSVLLQQTPPAAAEMPLLRVVVRTVIAALIAVLASYIVIEQVGSWRRRRSGRE